MKMKYLVAAAVVAMLIIAPFGSYFYLKSGLVYRLESMEQLKPKEASAEYKAFLDQVVNPHMAALIHLGGDDDLKGIELLKQVDDRIVDRDNFELFTLSSKGTFEPNAEIQYVEDLEIVDSEYQFMLIDTAGTLRYEYAYGPDHSKDMIRHLAVIIPVPKSREIKLRRELEE